MRDEVLPESDNMITISWDGDGIRISVLGQLLGRPTNLGAAPVAPTVEPTRSCRSTGRTRRAKPAPKKRGRPKAEPAPEPVAEDDDPLAELEEAKPAKAQSRRQQRSHRPRFCERRRGDLASPET